ncbi:pentapeptide repeat protein [Candidatus Moduliflexus flocculans]|uniref:Pentapeptide repeat protein n=1 Tax=Candidatus Moduliflexus flocculans TaxID=1499966 RepID=A0A0S6VPM8_9BACT|nr:pentapeptide repeat protein [Candidatus Moduliflexus flocculans]
MVNNDLVDLLEDSVEAWNDWREACPLVKIDLREADLREADLRKANLRGVDLRNADLNFAQLSLTVLDQAMLTGACLYGTARDDWSIIGVLCDYVFWENRPIFFGGGIQEIKQQWEAEHRVPKDRDFRPGEFEELYKQLPTFEYAFEHGFTPLDAVVMNRIVAAINEQHPEFELKLDSFQSRSQPHATFTVLHKEHLETAKQQVATTYERRILELEAQKTQLMEVVKMLGSGGFAFQPMRGGMNIRPMLPPALTQEIVAFLVALPDIHDRLKQQAFLLSAGLDAELFNQLHIGEPPTSFINALISNCMTYGQLNDGRHALIAVMNAAKQLVGKNRQADADTLIQQIEAQIGDNTNCG